MHFNNILGVTAYILITSSDLITSHQGTWKSVPQQVCILINYIGPLQIMLKNMGWSWFYIKIYARVVGLSKFFSAKCFCQIRYLFIHVHTHTLVSESQYSSLQWCCGHPRCVRIGLCLCQVLRRGTPGGQTSGRGLGSRSTGIYEDSDMCASYVIINSTHSNNHRYSTYTCTWKLRRFIFCYQSQT